VIQIRTEESLKQNIDDLKQEQIILNIDLDFRVPELDHISSNLKFDYLKKIIPMSKIITIATSPFFIDQDLAIKTLKKIIHQI
jgi:hypothetical protein